MKNITLGRTGIVVPQNGFGALPIQRISKEKAVRLLRRAYEGGMRYFDTARGYTDSFLPTYPKRLSLTLRLSTIAPPISGKALP